MQNMRKGERKKQDILLAAADLFAQKGYTETTIADILDRLACSKGSFYHHFDTKFAVLAELARQRASQAYATYIKSLPAGNPLAALNLLLYRASFLNPQSRDLVMSLRSLQQDFEGAALLNTMQTAVVNAFYPQFVSLLDNLRKADLAVYLNQESLNLAFHSFLSGCKILMLITDEQRGTRQSLLRALRRHLEQALGLSPGAIVILETDELTAFFDKPNA